MFSNIANEILSSNNWKAHKFRLEIKGRFLIILFA